LDFYENLRQGVTMYLHSGEIIFFYWVPGSKVMLLKKIWAMAIWTSLGHLLVKLSSTFEIWYVSK